MVRSSASPAVPRYGITYFARGLLTSALLPVSVWLIHSNQDVPPFAPVWFFSWVLTLAFQTHLQCTPKLSLLLHGGVYAVVAYSLQSWIEHPYPALPWAVSMLWWALYEAAEHLYVRYKAMNETIAHASILEARIRPHFLFNVLNCLRAMAPSHGPIGPALEDAAQLLRLALKPHSSFVRYCDERERLEHYLRLEHLRLEERLQVRWHVDEDVEDYDPWMPGFILQPLIENAIRHGIEKTPGHIDVALMHSGSYLQLEVTNPVPSNATEPLRYQGLGLAEDDVRVRLHLLYDQQASYSVHTTGTTHTATVRLPWNIRISG